jgi:hypothetical protein
MNANQAAMPKSKLTGQYCYCYRDFFSRQAVVSLICLWQKTHDLSLRGSLGRAKLNDATRLLRLTTPE